MKIKFYILLFLLSTSLFAQKVITSIDTTKNKIGAEFKLTIKTSVDTSSKVAFPNLKNIGALEVIQSYKIDTIRKDNRYELIKKYGLTQFDSGKYTIPSVKILINNKPFFTDSIRVEIANVVVDTLKQKMFDIKPITDVKSDKSWIWKLLLILLLIAGIGVFVYWFIKKRQNRQKPEEIIYKTPIEKATNLLQQLEKKGLWQKGEIKSYYSELTDIARNYIEEEIQIPAMESTTSELIISLRNVAKQKKLKLTKETLENLEKVLKQADLVKFAKSQPLDFEIEEDKKRISNSIVTIYKSIPVVTDETDELDRWNEQKKELIRIQKLKKQKTKRVIISLGVVFFILISTFLFLVFTKGFDYVKDNFIGHPTKELLEGEWITSEYGNPSIKIETPKVLKRTDLTQSLPKNGMALIKEMQSFSYGSVLDNFYIMVSTLKYKQDVEIDLSKSLDGAVQSVESQGAQNMIVKKEDFETKEGIKGIKGYGTFSKINDIDKTSAKLYYEILLFSQEGGLQQIIIFHEEGDKYANDISDRILNSVELKKISK